MIDDSSDFSMMILVLFGNLDPEEVGQNKLNKVSWQAI
jgi:hypothetical protein